MLLTIGIIGLFILVVSCGIFLGLKEPEPAEQLSLSQGARPNFFGPQAPGFQAGQPISVELLLSQLEQHIRTEEAAAEVFLRSPTPESLHVSTDSPWVN